MAGDAIAFLSAVSIRGISNPAVEDTISNIAEGTGVAPVVLIPTFCAKPNEETNRNISTVFRVINAVFFVFAIGIVSGYKN